MSYRHPRFYKEDYTGFNKGASAAFQQSFTDVKGYFDKKIEQRKEYEADLHAQADKMREAAAASGQVGAEFQKKLEENIQNFLKEGMAVDGMDKPGFFFQNVKETGKKDKLDLDKANANFNAEIAAANNITDRAFVAGLEIDEDYDHGSGSYLEYASVVKALQSNFKEGGNVDFKYKGEGSNEFGFGVTINNPRWRPGDPEEEKMITYSAQDVQRLIGENDPKARAQIEENINTAVDSLVKTAKSDLDERFASGRASGKDGVLYKGETSVENTVAQYMREMRQQDENNPDDPSIIDDIFNNKVKFNDNIRLQELERVEGSANLIGLANSEDNAEKLAMLLDMPHNELSYSKKILNEMGVKDVDGALKTLEAAKNNMVERYLKNEVMGSGIASKYIDPKVEQPPKGSSASGSSKPQSDGYAEKKFSEITEFLGGSTGVADEESGFVAVGNFDEQYGTTYNKDMDKIFLNQKISTDVGDRDIKEVLYNPDTKEIAFSYIANKNMKLKVNKDGKQEFGDLGDDTAVFDLSDPVAFEKLYQKIGTKADGESKDSRAYEVKYKQLAQNYGLSNFINHLADQGTTGKVDVNSRQFAGGKKMGDMSKWVTYTLRNNPSEIFDYFIDRGTLINSGEENEFNLGEMMVTPPGGGDKMTFNDYMVVLQAKRDIGQI